jgi:hypothetical protein
MSDQFGEIVNGIGYEYGSSEECHRTGCEAASRFVCYVGYDGIAERELHLCEEHNDAVWEAMREEM